jgi:hypothetical protein
MRRNSSPGTSLKRENGSPSDDKRSIKTSDQYNYHLLKSI